MDPVRGAALDDPAAWRHAGSDLLALGLMDTRNALLARLPALQDEDAAPLRRRLLDAGAWPEWWISRHVQRQRGEAADPALPRLPGLEPRLEAWRSGAAPLSLDELRGYLAATLELTLELLAATPEDDAALAPFRQALRHEDRLLEALRTALGDGAPAPRPQRPPLDVPAARTVVGTDPAGGGFVPEAERGREAVVLPPFEIDAQPVAWAAFAEFAADGGYDDDRLWTVEGRAWRERTGRRAPACVEQLQGGVLVQRGHGARARLERAPSQQAVAHVTRHEAQAWCAWAGRRLPTDVEWSHAAATLPRLGFAFGDVHEWVLGTARPWDGAGPWPPAALDEPGPGRAVLRGPSWATPARWRTAAARRFAAPEDDGAACGFRSCAR